MEKTLIENNSFPAAPKMHKFEDKILRLFSFGEKRKASKLIEKHLEEGNIISNKQLLMFVLEPSGMTVAHKLALQGIKLSDPEVLTLKGEDRSKENATLGHSGCSVAYIMARMGHSFNDPSILRLGSEDGRASVAHAMAEKGCKFEDKDI